MASAADPSLRAAVGVVVIGRNEGSRLVRSLASVVDRGVHVVYVDSGSNDGSPEAAANLGVPVVRLDPSRPFSAGRGRNEGFEALCGMSAGLEFVQFLDGDTELADGWLELGARYLAANPDTALASGELQEQSPETSSFHRLANMEWQAQPGEIRSAGGNAMVRARAFRDVGGYRAEMIAGEDPELCVRLRNAGHRIVHLDGKMGRHDADMLRFRQWWLRSLRDGHAYAEILFLHRRNPERYWVRKVASIVVWGGVIPLVAVLGACRTPGLSALLLATLGVQWLRVFRRSRREGAASGDAALYAGHCVVGKFGECAGVALFAWNRMLRRRKTGLIEHKDESAPRNRRAD